MAAPEMSVPEHPQRPADFSIEFRDARFSYAGADAHEEEDEKAQQLLIKASFLATAIASCAREPARKQALITSCGALSSFSSWAAGLLLFLP